MAVTHQIRLQKWVTSKDGSGDHVETVTKNISTFAEVIDTGGSKAFDFGDTKMVTNKRFRVRLLIYSVPTGNWRIIYNGRSYTITSIEQENEKRFFWIFNGTAE